MVKRRKDPLQNLSHSDLKKLRDLIDEPNLSFYRAVEILGLDPKRDFRGSDLSGIRFDGMDTSEFDLTGAKLFGCSFVGVTSCESSGSLTVAGEFDIRLEDKRIVSLQLSGDGKSIVLCNGDGEIALIDADRLIRNFVFKPEGFKFRRVGFLGQGSYFFGISDHGLLRIWDSKSGTIESEISVTKREVLDVGYYDGAFVALIELSKGVATLWDVRAWYCIRVFEGADSRILSGELNTGAKRILTASKNAEFQMWDLETGKQIFRSEQYGTGPFWLSFGNTEGWLILIRPDGTVQLYYAATGGFLRDFNDDIGKVRSATFFPDALIVCVVGRSKIVAFDIRYNFKIFDGRFNFEICSFYTNGVSLIVAGRSGEISMSPLRRKWP